MNAVRDQVKILTVLLNQFLRSCEFAQGAEEKKKNHEMCAELVLLPPLTVLHPCTGAGLVEHQEVFDV